MGIRLFFAFLFDCLWRIFSCFYFSSHQYISYSLCEILQTFHIRFILSFFLSLLIPSVVVVVSVHFFLSFSFFSSGNVLRFENCFKSNERVMQWQNQENGNSVIFTWKKKSQHLIEFPRSSYNRHNSKNVFRVYFIVHVSCPSHTQISIQTWTHSECANGKFCEF